MSCLPGKVSKLLVVKSLSTKSRQPDASIDIGTEHDIGTSGSEFLGCLGYVVGSQRGDVMTNSNDVLKSLIKYFGKGACKTFTKSITSLALFIEYEKWQSGVGDLPVGVRY